MVGGSREDADEECSTEDTDGSSSREDIEAYILSSKYRSSVLENLATGGRATPKEIAEAEEAPRPHVSRAISELRERSVVELRVPETRSVGRYYGLTGKGEAAWRNLKEELRGVRWSIKEASEPEVRAAIELAKDEFGEGLRAVGTYDREGFSLYHVRSDVRSGYSEEAFENVLSTLLLDHPLDDLEIPGGDCRSETIHFDEFVLLRVRIGSDRRIVVSFEETQNVSIPQFSERIRSVAERE